MNTALIVALTGTFIMSRAMALDISVDNNADCNSDAGTPFCTISDALVVALPGDTITVAHGTYSDNVEVNVNNVNIIGIGVPTLTTSGSIARGIVTINASGVKFEGFNVTGWTNGVVILGNNNTVVRNSVHNNGFIEIAVGDFSAEPVRVTGNTIAHNNVIGGQNGIAVNGDRNTIVSNSTLSDRNTCVRSCR